VLSALLVVGSFTGLAAAQDGAADGPSASHTQAAAEEAAQSGTPATAEEATSTESPVADATGDANTSSPASSPAARKLAATGSAAIAPLAAAAAIKCTPGTVYSVSSGGQLREVTNGTVTDVGTAASDVSSFNGLGIGSGGQPIYAYERTNSSQTVTMHRYDPSTGNWTNTGDTYNTTLSANGSYSGALVAGAVNLSNGAYLFGGFQTTDNGQFANPRYTQVFKIWQYSSSANPKFSYKGFITTYSGASQPGAANGDMAFDAAGNLFVVRGSGTSTTVFSVTAANLGAANGGAIPSSGSTSFPTTDNVNGVAFDASGKAYLGAGTTIESFDMPDWSNKQTVTSSLSGSTDLASCSSPATITLQKVVHGRVNPSDQFTLTLADGGTTLGTATTVGTANGVQDNRVGPQPTARGEVITFREAGAGGANLSNYATTYQCTVDGKAMSPAVSGTGTTGSVTIPDTGEAILCQFTNSPLVAHVNVTKTVVDNAGADPQPGVGWTVGSATTATAGTATQNPTGAQQTDGTGTASWTITYGTAQSAAEVAVSETQKPGYAFASGQCTVTDNNGTAGAPIPITAASGATVPQVLPGETLDCSFVNQEQKASLTLVKAVSNTHGGTAVPADFPLTATPSGGEALSFTSGTTKDVDPGTYAIGETLRPGYTQTSLVCTSGAETLTVTNGSVDVMNAQDVVCTLTNADTPGSVSWTKVGPDGTTPLGGSEWTLTGPAGATATTVTDCVAGASTDCTGPDTDPEAGGFSVENLAWGDYTLTESKAPAGYLRSDTTYSFTISGSALTATVNDGAPLVNEQATPPALPLTGGMSTDAFLLAGGGLILVAGAGGYFLSRRRSLTADHGE